VPQKLALDYCHRRQGEGPLAQRLPQRVIELAPSRSAWFEEALTFRSLAGTSVQPFRRQQVVQFRSGLLLPAKKLVLAAHSLAEAR
jgi:hypothetical protein